MQITEIYRSLQGESSYTGLPCIFVRLTGCNLRCAWCDTEYAFQGGRKMSVDEVIAQVRATGSTRLVEITGGEPMLQEQEAAPLMQRLLDDGYTVLLETSGERPLARVPDKVIKIVDVKCPGSGQESTFRLENLDTLKPQDELKFVLTGRADYEFARDFLVKHDLSKRGGSIIFSPAFAKTAAGNRDTSNCLLDPRELAEWILHDQLSVRLGLQVHKFIWDPALKSV
jgi:7-carboxy-7-deazaguanine synthase